MKNDIIDVAYKCAIEDGLDNVSLTKVAQLLYVSRRNIYRFFADKEELMFEVYKRVLGELIDEAAQLNKLNDHLDGYNQSVLAIENMITVFLDNPSKIKYVSQFDALNIKNLELLEEKNEFYLRCAFTYSFLKKGVNDGTISKEINPFRMGCVILESVLGIVVRVYDFDKNMFKNYMDKEMIYDLVDIFGSYLIHKDA